MDILKQKLHSIVKNHIADDNKAKYVADYLYYALASYATNDDVYIGLSIQDIEDLKTILTDYQEELAK